MMTKLMTDCPSKTVLGYSASSCFYAPSALATVSTKPAFQLLETQNVGCSYVIKMGKESRRHVVGLVSVNKVCGGMQKSKKK